MTGNFISYIIDRKLGVTYMLVGIIGAMDLEVQALKGLMDNAVVETISTILIFIKAILTAWKRLLRLRESVR